jgi:methylmalonyl-CoA mutase N-terminal domain/subunit
VAAERQGVDVGVLNGTLQTDIFKEYIAQKEWLFEPGPHLRLIGDLMEYCAEKIPAYKPLSVSGYHIREAGSTAAQELAFTLADGFGYVELGLSRGLDVDVFAPGLSFFFDSHLDFFEEIAKFRAARRIWARWLRDVYGAKTDKAQWLRFHTQTAGVSLTAQQPLNNVVRTRCTPTLSTRRSRCRPSSPPRWPCARSRSSWRRPAWSTSPTRSAGPGTSRR